MWKWWGTNKANWSWVLEINTLFCLLLIMFKFPIKHLKQNKILPMVGIPSWTSMAAGIRWGLEWGGAEESKSQQLSMKNSWGHQTKMEVTSWPVTGVGACCRYKKSSEKGESSMGWTIKNKKEIEFKFSLKEVRFSWLEGSERDTLSQGQSTNKDSDME